MIIVLMHKKNKARSTSIKKKLRGKTRYGSKKQKERGKKNYKRSRSSILNIRPLKKDG